MTNYPHHHPHDLMSETLLDQLVADAQNWRNLTQALNDRGFTDFGPTDIAAIVALYPNFRAMAHALPDDTDQQAVPALQGPPDPFLDAVRSVRPSMRSTTVAPPLTPSGAKPYQKPPISIPGLEEMEIQPITYLESIFGPVIAGYTVDNLLAFAFEDLREVRTIPLTVLLADLVREMKRTSLSPKNKPTKSTRLM